MKILYIIISFLLSVIIGLGVYYNYVIAQKDKEIAQIKTEDHSLPNDYQVMPVTPDSILVSQWLDSLKKTIKPRIIEKTETLTDSSQIDSLNRLIALLDEKAKQYKDSLAIYIEFADTTINIENACTLDIEYWGTPLSIFTFSERNRHYKTKVYPHYIKPDKQFIFGGNVGSYFDGKVLYGITGQVIFTGWGMGAEICNRSGNLQVLKSFNFYKETQK